MGEDLPLEYFRCLDHNCGQIQSLVLKPNDKAEFKNISHGDYNFYTPKLFGKWKVNIDTLLLTDYAGQKSRLKILQSHDLTFLIPLERFKNWNEVEREFFKLVHMDETYSEIIEREDLTSAQKSRLIKRVTSELWTSSLNSEAIGVYIEKIE